MFPTHDKRARSLQEIAQLRSQILLTLPASLNFLVMKFGMTRPEMMKALVKLQKSGYVRTEGREIWYLIGERKEDAPSKE